jgi:hypothetical protein
MAGLHSVQATTWHSTGAGLCPGKGMSTAAEVLQALEDGNATTISYILVPEYMFFQPANARAVPAIPYETCFEAQCCRIRRRIPQSQCAI